MAQNERDTTPSTYGGIDTGNTGRDHYSPADNATGRAGDWYADPHTPTSDLGDAANEGPLNDETSVGTRGLDDSRRAVGDTPVSGGSAMGSGGEENRGMGDTGADLAAVDMDATEPHSMDRSELEQRDRS